MSPSHFPPLVFLCKATFYLAVLLPVYTLVVPAYIQLVGALCLALTSYGPFGLTMTVIDGTWHVVVDGSSASFLLGNRTFTERLFFDITILPSLILATPAGVRRRIIGIVIGEALLLVFNAGSLLLSAHGIALLCAPDLSSRGCRLLAGMPGLLGMIVTCTLWFLLTWSTWSNGIAQMTRRHVH
jgi:hypothetical protein